MALTEKQLKIVNFTHAGFQNITGIAPCYFPPSAHHHTDEGKDFGVNGDNSVRCIWASLRVGSVKVNASLSRYGGLLERGSYIFAADRARGMSLRFRDSQYEVPRIRVQMQFDHKDASLDSLVEDLEHAQRFTSGVERAAHSKRYDPFILDIWKALKRNFPADRNYMRHIRDRTTYVGKFHGLGEGVYLTLPFDGHLGGPQYVILNDVARVAKRNIGKLLKARDQIS